MAVLSLQSVTKRYSTARRERTALREVSLEVADSEMVAVWGVRRSGRSTLLRVSAGMERPDDGLVRFCGQDAFRRREDLLGTQVGYCNPTFMASQGGNVLDHVAVGPLARGVARNRARSRAEATLARVGVADCAELDPRLLDPSESVRVGIARALINEPRLLLLDEPTNGVDLLARDPILDLIRSIADDGVAVLMTVGEAVTQADRVLSIDRGELRGDATPDIAAVVPIKRPRAGSA